VSNRGYHKCHLTRIISSRVIEHLRDYSTEDDCVLWIYLDYTDAAQKDHQNIIRSLLKQLLLPERSISDDIIRDMLKQHKKQKHLDLHDAFDFLYRALQQFGKCYICIDVLDEYGGKNAKHFFTGLK
jgi:hypothetical protein